MATPSPSPTPASAPEHRGLTRLEWLVLALVLAVAAAGAVLLFRNTGAVTEGAPGSAPRVASFAVVAR